MKRIVAAVIGGMVLVSASANAQQGTVFLVGTGGASIPTGDFGDVAKTGWMASGGVGYDITNHLFIVGIGRYGTNKLKAIDEDQKMTGFDGSLGYSFGSETSRMAPYVRAGYGVLKGKVGDVSGDSKGTAHGAIGLYMPKGKWGWFVEGQYNTNDDVDFIVASIGFTWAIRMGAM
jgi:hypothetical protein